LQVLENQYKAQIRPETHFLPVLNTNRVPTRQNRGGETEKIAFGRHRSVRLRSGLLSAEIWSLDGRRSGTEVLKMELRFLTL
jgi:hypothetical protein